MEQEGFPKGIFFNSNMAIIRKKIKNSDWKIRDYEEELFFHELEPFFPDKIFDAHVYIFNKSYLFGEFPEYITRSPVDNMTIAKYMEEIIHGREISGLFFGWVKSGENFNVDLDRTNKFISKQAKEDPNCRGSMLVDPDMDNEFIRQEVRRLKLSGLKCYCYY